MPPANRSSAIVQLATVLKQAEFELDAVDLADIIWLAQQMGGATQVMPSSRLAEDVSLEDNEPIREPISDAVANLPESPLEPLPEPPPEPLAAVYSQPPTQTSQPSTPDVPVLPLQAPAVSALRNSLELGRALRPLMRKVPSRTQQVIDEESTAVQIAEEKIWTPVLQAAPERWLELALVIEESSSLPIWQETIREFQQLLERQGAFRDVRSWRLVPSERGNLQLFPGRKVDGTCPRSPKELLDAAGRRLILLVSDCVSPAWKSDEIGKLLEQWVNQVPVTVVQLLPARCWNRTMLGAGVPVQLSAFAPGLPNPKLEVGNKPTWLEDDLEESIPLTLPIVSLEPERMIQWARVIAGMGCVQTQGILLYQEILAAQVEAMTEASDKELSAVERVRRFHASASLTARKLAGLMAAAPVSLPVVNLIQQTLLKEESNSLHVAEVFMGGLLKREPSAQMFLGENIEYDFFEGVRSLLIETTPISSTVSVLDVLSSYVAEKLGKSVRRFTAFVSQYWDWDESSQQNSKPFAQLTSQVLRRLGGDYAVLAERLEQPILREVFRLTESTSVVETLPSNSTLPRAEQLELFEFSEEATDQPEPATVPDEKLSLELQPFQFETVTLEVQAQGTSGKQAIIVTRRESLQASQWVELLPERVPLEMVLIPKGQFLMGAPEKEEDSRSSERPQHQVTVPEFLMGKYPVTQVQWKAVAGLPKVRQELNPNPSEFKGDDLPVEQVSWLDAVEFCDRLSRYTERQYQLPSEAQWEYACRGGTVTSFHFGETISTEVANYDGNNAYGDGHKGIYRRGTTPVGSFGVANRFGLYDLHGTVWEWCADHWHQGYESAPTDGSTWTDGEASRTASRILRGGSWDNSPRLCRSACRNNNLAVIRDHTFGFRIVCVATKAL